MDVKSFIEFETKHSLKEVCQRFKMTFEEIQELHPDVFLSLLKIYFPDEDWGGYSSAFLNAYESPYSHGLQFLSNKIECGYIHSKKAALALCQSLKLSF